MMNRIFAPLAVVAALGLAGGAARAQAEDAAPAPYPDPQCAKPEAALIQPGSRPAGNAYDSSAAGDYNSRIRAYNKAAKDYFACMHAYIDSANRDMKAVQDKANADLKRISDTANASMKAIQDKMRQAVQDANDVSAAENAAAESLKKNH